MIEIDVHGWTVAETLDHVVVRYRQQVQRGSGEKICVIHGVGAIRDALREQLTAVGIDFVCGELDGPHPNPGRTTLETSAQSLFNDTGPRRYRSSRPRNGDTGPSKGGLDA